MKYLLSRVRSIDNLEGYIEVLKDKFTIIKEVAINYAYIDSEDDETIDKYYIELNTMEELEKLRNILKEINSFSGSIVITDKAYDIYTNLYNEPTLEIYDDYRE